MKPQYLLGIDIGTTSVKGALVSTNAQHVLTTGREYSLEYPSPNWCEIDPRAYWEGTRHVIRDLLAESRVSPDEILAIAFSSQGETLIPIDKSGEPLRKAIVWLDNRSGREAAAIKQQFGAEAILAKTGQPETLPIWPATRILWLREHEPEVFRRADKYLLVQDYLVQRLTGRFATNPSMVSSTLYYDIVRMTWWPAMLDFLGITSAQLPEVVPSGTMIGHLTKEAAEATGLSENVAMVAGAYDHPAGAIGCGNLQQGVVSETTGASMAMVVTLDKPMLDPSLRLSCQCHAIPGKYFLLPYGQTAGFVLKWFKDNFGQPNAGSDAYAHLDALAQQVAPGSDGLIVLPHFMGAGSPEFNENARGVFCGVTPSMHKGHFVRAILESVALMIRTNLDVLNAAGVRTREIRAVGGGAKSSLWNQINADCSGVPFITFQSSEPTSLGVAILAGVGCGVFADIEEGCRRLVRVGGTIEPNPGHSEIYEKLLARYQQLYRSLEPYWAASGSPPN